MLINDKTGEVMEIVEPTIDGYELTANAIEVINGIEREMKRLKTIYAEYKDALLDAMEKYNINEIDTPSFVASYVAPYTTSRIDTKSLKNDHPELTEKYKKVSMVKSSVRVTLK